ncbi:hypothetical protein N9L47_13845, partial [Rhodobacteraceae bacterium]|nr:hypothetical protein [Paracoccaceae bacterium]
RPLNAKACEMNAIFLFSLSVILSASVAAVVYFLQFGTFLSMPALLEGWPLILCVSAVGALMSKVASIFAQRVLPSDHRKVLFWCIAITAMLAVAFALFAAWFHIVPNV